MRALTKNYVAATMFVAVSAFASLSDEARAQTTVSTAPTMIPVSGQFLTVTGEPRVGTVVLAISLYGAQGDPAPQWVEHQTVTLDVEGRYSISFGSTRDDGLPAYLFTDQPIMRWLGVGILNEPEQPRVQLVAVPYAAKAGSAATLEGKAATDFVLASTFKEDVRAALEDEGTRTSGDGVTTQDVTADYLQKGASGGGTTDSIAYENAGKIGIGTTTPAARLDVQTAGGSTPLNISTSAAGTNYLLAQLVNSGATLQYGVDSSSGAAFGAGSYAGVFGSAGATPLALFTNSLPRLTILSGGNVGIGTTSPDRLLTLRSAEPTLGWIESDASANNGRWQFVVSSETFYVQAQNDAGSGNTAIQIERTGTTVDSVSLFGNVGIGTTNPTSRLHVAGDVTVDGNIGAKYQDIAEWVDAAEPLEAGSVVVIDMAATNRVLASTRSYDSRVAGAVSPQPGIVLGEKGEGRVLVAQSGRVRIKADAQYGAIRPGDLLVSSPTKGHAMKSRGVKVGDQIVHRPGTLIGKALEALPNGKGEILVLLTLQ